VISIRHRHQILVGAHALGRALLLGRGAGEDRERVGSDHELRLSIVAPALDLGLTFRADDEHRDAFGAAHRLRIHHQLAVVRKAALGSIGSDNPTQNTNRKRHNAIPHATKTGTQSLTSY
jgi:hypothetical protein